jgi:hypothetical protein
MSFSDALPKFPAEGDAKRSSAILLLTLLPRFARHAVVALFGQIHLRISCPPFYLREFQETKM